MVNGTEHDIENRGISPGRRYREVRTSDEVRYSHSSGRALTVNLKFADGTYLGSVSVTKAMRTLDKEDARDALGIKEVRESLTSVLQDETVDASSATTGESAVTATVPFD